MSMYIPRGAWILSRSTKRFGGLIRWGTQRIGEAPTRVSHSMLTVQEGIYPALQLWQQPLIGEADVRVRVGPLGAYHAQDKLIIYQIEMTPAEIDTVVGYVLSKEGLPYAPVSLIPQLIDTKIFFGWNVTRRLFKVSPLKYCSRLTGEAGEQVGIRLGPPGYAQSPDDQDDVLRAAAQGSGLAGRRVTCLLDQVGDPPLKRRS